MIRHKYNTDIRAALNLYHLGYDTEYRTRYWYERIYIYIYIYIYIFVDAACCHNTLLVQRS